MRESGLTPVPVALDARQQRFTARLASTCEGSKLQTVHDHPTSGTLTWRVITKEHERGREAETMRWPNPDKEPAVRTVMLSEDAAKNEAIGWARERGDLLGERKRGQSRCRGLNVVDGRVAIRPRQSRCRHSVQARSPLESHPQPPGHRPNGSLGGRAVGNRTRTPGVSEQEGHTADTRSTEGSHFQ